MDREAILETLQGALPGLIAVYAFGSRIEGTAHAESDLDLAVLVAGYADPLVLWELSGRLSEVTLCPVDLLDFRAASTVMQYQILSKGMRWYAMDSTAAIYEAAVLSEKTELDQARAGLIRDIQKAGRVYGVDDVLLNKAATIERGVLRAREEYNRDPATFSDDFTRQDAAILNIQRACEAALDIEQHLVRRENLGVPQSARDLFSLLAKAGLVTTDLAEKLKRMVGFRNIAVHDYQTLQLPITVRIIESHLDDFLDFTQILLQRDAGFDR